MQGLRKSTHGRVSTSLRGRVEDVRGAVATSNDSISSCQAAILSITDTLARREDEELGARREMLSLCSEKHQSTGICLGRLESHVGTQMDMISRNAEAIMAEQGQTRSWRSDLAELRDTQGVEIRALRERLERTAEELSMITNLSVSVSEASGKVGAGGSVIESQPL